MTYAVVLDNRGNPDFGQISGRRLPGTQAETRAVKNFEEASKACRAYIEENGLGGGNWMGGTILDAKGNEVGRVSYNGRVWAPGPDRIGDKAIWPPSEPETPADPFEKEDAIIDTPFGPMEIGGCFRVGLLKSVPGEFGFEGKRFDFTTYVDLDPKKGLKRFQECDVLIDGRYDRRAPMPASVMAAVKEHVQEWLQEPGNMAMIVRNEIKDRQRNVHWNQERIEKLEQEMDVNRQEIAHEERAISKFAAMLDKLKPETDAPRPR